MKAFLVAAIPVLLVLQSAEPTVDALRAAAQQRMREDRARYSQDEMRQIETLYQSANRDLKAAGARAALQELIAKYPQSNRAGCALLYVARMSQGEEREKLLTQAIANHSDARYGDGTQVGAFARALLAEHYARTNRVGEARKLAAEVQSEFPGAIDHSGGRIADVLRRLNLLGGGAPAAQQPAKLKVHISVDMEGVAGAVTAEQLGPTGFEYGRFREFMTKEALAAVQAAKAAGATEIIVADSHGNGQNLLIDQFPNDVRIIRSWPRRLGMVAGIDDTVDAAVFIGYHAGTNNPTGVRAHTFSSANLTRVAINGVNVTEGSWNAAIAGHFNVPVVMISGDDAAIAEVRKAVGNIEAAETKRSFGFHSAVTLTPQASYELIGQRVRAAFARRGDFKPYKVQAPVTVDVSFKNYMPAEVLAYLPTFERTDSHSIRFRAKDMVEASMIMTFIGEYRPDITP